MLLSVSHIAKHFANEIVLEDVSFRLDGREKVALVGRNGAGKTTLLRILTHEYEPDAGSVQLAKGVTVGYLSQQSALDDSKTVIEEAESARKHLIDLERRLEDLTKRMEVDPTAEDLEEFSVLQSHFIEEGGYSVERDIQTVLARMGFSQDEFDKPVKALSGGEKTRLTLAKLLLEEPELLILDEPTNHLDLEATEFLEGWLVGYGGAVLIVSHDRTFLQNVASRVIELRDGKAKSYPGNFEKFLLLKEAEAAYLAEVAGQQQSEMAKLDEFVRRFMNSQRTAQARGRLKHLEKLKANAIQAPKKERGMAAGFGKVERSGDSVIECKALSMQFGDDRLFQNLDWNVRWGERWGVVGANGAGKSTLAKIILKRLSATSGSTKLGANVKSGYFAQDGADYDLNQTPLQLMNSRLRLEEGPARNLLARFLISGDDVFRSIKTLSGGERNKLALAVLTAQNPNLLILDEPTNHLDMESREALAEVLHEYNGTLVLISHDRWLLQEVTDHTLDIQKESAIQFPGHYGEYKSFRESRKERSNQPKTAAPIKTKFDGLSPRELSKEIQRVEKLVGQIEDKIAEIEAEIKRIEDLMSSPTPKDDIYQLSLDHQAADSRLAEAMAEWEAAHVDLEDLKNKQASPVK